MFEDIMNRFLQNLANNIIPSDEFLKNADTCANNIITLLQAKSRFKIGKVCMAGSIGKKTTILGSDIDVVLFINDEQPPFEGVLEDFENILTLSDSFAIRNVRSTRFSIQFTALDIDFDILPAANFTKCLQGDGDQLINVQEQRVLEIIGRDPKKYCYMYSSSLAFSALRFMKQQDGFVNQMVRIAKFWFKTLCFEGTKVRKSSGAKGCVELIAVFAALQEDAMPTKSYLRAFERFIHYIQNIDHLNIHFGNAAQQFMDPEPHVMDPVNPYNNLARNWDRESVQLLKCYANESRNRLDQLANLRVAHSHLLFEPQPVFRPDMHNIFGTNETRYPWLIGVTAVSLRPDLKVRNERFHTDDKLSKGLHILKIFLQFAIYASKAAGYDLIQIREVIQNTISRQIYNTEMKWKILAEDKKHEDYDITFTIPIDSTWAISVSYKL